MDKLSDLIKERVLAQMDFSKEMDDEEVQELVAREISRCPEVKNLSIQKRVVMEQHVYHSLRRLDILQNLIEDEDVTEILVNGPENIFYEKDGQLLRYPYQFSSEERLQDVIQQIVGKHNRVVNLRSPIVDTRLEDGSRVNVVLKPIAIDGSAISIRKFSKNVLDMNALIQSNTISKEAADLLKLLVSCRYNLFISGGTSSGKTTFLNALSSYISKDERIITIEDSAELQLQGIDNYIRLETRNANQDGIEPITARSLIHTALRMRPDRIIVGECRGAETLDMLQAMNTGHDGSLSTGHANSTRDMLSRLETMVLMGMELPLEAIRQQIASGIDILVHLERGADRKRRVVEISELIGIKDNQIQLNTLYRYTNRLERVNQLQNTAKIRLNKREEPT